ncbi:MAG: type VI secretion system baseplate subunit TssG [Chitinispirillaceae bacterium]|jgi:type VI secretion system protein ImpH
MADLIEFLEREAGRLNFFGAVALLEEHFEDKGVADPMGAGSIQFEPDPSLSFPTSDIVSITRHDGRIVFRLSFMGLAGVSSPLPVYFSDYIVQHEAEAAALLDFLTIFNNRMYALFYRAWKKYRLISSAGDPLVRCIAALAGIPLNMDLPASALRSLAYAGLNAGAPRSHASLEALVSDYFGNIPVKVTEFMPRWAPLPDPMRLGDNDNARLGQTAILGTFLYDLSGKFRVSLGPLTPGMFESFLPKGKNHAALKGLIESFLAEPLDYDIEVLLESRDLSAVILGADNAKLGETAALGEAKGTSEIKSMVIEGRSIGG